MMTTRNKFLPTVRERTARMVDERRADYVSECAPMTSIAAKIGCKTETLRRWYGEEVTPGAADAACKIAASFAIFAPNSMLIGAFIASVAGPLVDTFATGIHNPLTKANLRH